MRKGAAVDSSDGGLIGLRVWGDSVFALPLKHGLTVLYGQNGAGKSTILESLACALTGRRGRLPVELHLNIPVTRTWTPPREARIGDHVIPLGGERLHKHLPLCPRTMIDGLRSSDDLPGETVRSWERSRLSCFDEEGLAQAASAQHSLALVPVGSDRPQWQVWLTADPTDATLKPWVDQAEALLSRFAQQQDALEASFGQDDLSDGGRSQIEEELLLLGWDLDSDPWITSGTSVPLSRYRDDDFRIYWENVVRYWRETGIPTAPKDGLPVLLAHLTTVEALTWPLGLTEPSDDSLQSEFLRRLETVAAPIRHRENKSVLQSALDIECHTLTESSNTICGSLLTNAPNLKAYLAPSWDLQFTSQFEWLAGTPDAPAKRSSYRPFSQLSAAEQRWARIAALLAMQERQQEGTEAWTPMYRATALVIDEPEAHLHRAAEKHAAEGLRSLIPDRLDYLVVATHSPHLLDVPDAHLLWVHSNEPHVFTGADLDRIESLGLLPSDLLSITRTILIVEGHHDELVLKSLIGDQLRAANTRIVPLHGGKGLSSVVDSQVLFHFTQARVVGLLDNISARRVTEVWEHANVLAAQQGVEPAVKYIHEALPGKEDGKSVSENLYMRQWFTEALKAPDSFPRSRMAPFGLEKADILEYLPVQAFVSTASSWEALRDEWRAHSQSRTTNSLQARNFKAWLAATYSATFDDDLIREAADVATIPDEFVALVRTCQHVGHAPETEAGL